MSAVTKTPWIDAADSASRGERLIAALKSTVGNKYVLTKESATRRYRTGFRFGEGRALAVVRPGTLAEQWKVLQACLSAKVIVITQASNTGITGGSTPDGNDYDRDIVIVSTTRIRKIHVIDGGRQVICLSRGALCSTARVGPRMGWSWGGHSIRHASCSCLDARRPPQD
jgi:D-lactate dehydrogenase